MAKSEHPSCTKIGCQALGMGEVIEARERRIDDLESALVTIERWARDRKSGNDMIPDVLEAIAERAQRANPQ